MKKKLLQILSIGIFCLLLSAMLFRISYVCRVKTNTGMQDQFMALKRDSVDLVFIGTSHQFCSIDPELLAEEFGINSFMLACSGQTVPMSYYAAKEAIAYQHPDTIVFELGYMSNDFKTINPEMSHMFFDGMPLDAIKREAIDDLIDPQSQDEEDKIYYYLNLGKYHARWKELTEEDFISNLNMPRGHFYSDHVEVLDLPCPLVSAQEKERPDEEMMTYLDRLVALCRENQVRLILYVAPFTAMLDAPENWEDLYACQRKYNYLEEYAAQMGLPFHNLFYELDAIGLDPQQDYMDPQHTNCFGQQKITRYMAQNGYFN